MKILALLMALFAVTALAAEKKVQPRTDVTCPVLVTSFKPNYPHGRYTKWTEIKWRNNTQDKVIVGVKFRPTYYNAVEEYYEDMSVWTQRVVSKPLESKGQKGLWDESFEPFMVIKCSLRVEKVMFQNGEIFMSSGDECTFGHRAKYQYQSK